jgi:hypothetical protein
MLSSLSRHRSERVYVEIGWSLCSAQNGMLHCNNIVGRGRNLSSFRNNRWTKRAALIRSTTLQPVKHGLLARVREWPCSLFHRYARRGMLPGDWAGDFSKNRMRFGERKALVFVAAVREKPESKPRPRSRDCPPPLPARRWQGRNAAGIFRGTSGRAPPLRNDIAARTASVAQIERSEKSETSVVTDAGFSLPLNPVHARFDASLSLRLEINVSQRQTSSSSNIHRSSICELSQLKYLLLNASIAATACPSINTTSPFWGRSLSSSKST